MTTAISFRDAQKLQIVRSDDGVTDGYLHCTVVIDFGASAPLKFEDSLSGVPVSLVLNPDQGIFLADEVQRLMRLGIGAWLQIEARSDRVVSCQRLRSQDSWEVTYRLPLENGGECDLRAAVAKASSEDEALVSAEEIIRNWNHGLDRRPLGQDLAEVLGELDLSYAPRLSCGLALVDR